MLRKIFGDGNPGRGSPFRAANLREDFLADAQSTRRGEFEPRRQLIEKYKLEVRKLKVFSIVREA